MSRRRRRPGGGLFGTTAPYAATPVFFDGTTPDYLTRGAGLTGAADSKLLSGSFWLRRTTTGQEHILAANSPANLIRFQNNNTLAIIFVNSASATILNIASSAITDTAWHHFLFSVDLSDVNKRHLFVDDADDLNVTTYTDDTMDLTFSDVALGATVFGLQEFTGDMADLWLSFGTYIDLSVAANRRNFITASGQPASPALYPSTGIIELRGAVATWHVNAGSGGGFTENGELTAGTSPVEL